MRITDKRAVRSRKELLCVRVKPIIAAILGLVIMAGTITVHSSTMDDLFKKGTAASPAAMGNANVANTDGSDSLYWNPAGLGNVDGPTAITTHSSMSDFDMTTDMFNIAWPIMDGKATMGFGVFRSSISNIELVPAAARPTVTDYFTERETGIQLGIGKKIGSRTTIGATLKYLEIDLLDYNESAIGLDLGIMFEPVDGLKFGVNLQNVLEPELGVDEIPFNAKIGLAYTTPGDRFTLAADFDTDVYDDTMYHVGAELWIIPQVAARIGSNDGELTAGVGLTGFGNWSFDYAYDDADVGDTHKFSVRFDLNTQPKKTKLVKKKVLRKVKKSEAGKAVEEPKTEPEPVVKKEEPKPVVKKEEPKPAPAPKKEEPKPVVKEAPKPAPAPKKEEPKPVVKEAPKPAPVPAPVKMTTVDAYSFSEGDSIVSISYTDLQAGQKVVILKGDSKVADVEIIEVGMLSTSGKITKLYLKEIDGYLIGDKLGLK